MWNKIPRKNRVFLFLLGVTRSILIIKKWSIGSRIKGMKFIYNEIPNIPKNVNSLADGKFDSINSVSFSPVKLNRRITK